MTMSSCLYRNTSSQMVILRCIGPEVFFQEKVVFPFEDWLFHCPPQSRVDVWTHGITGAEKLDSINSDDLLLPADAVTPDRPPAEHTKIWTYVAGHKQFTYTRFHAWVLLLAVCTLAPVTGSPGHRAPHAGAKLSPVGDWS